MMIKVKPDHLQEFLKVSSKKSIANEIGISVATFNKFLSGKFLYSSTREKISHWYRNKMGIKQRRSEKSVFFEDKPGVWNGVFLGESFTIDLNYGICGYEEEYDRRKKAICESCHFYIECEEKNLDECTLRKENGSDD